MLRPISLALATCSLLLASCGDAAPRPQNQAGLALPTLTQQPAQGGDPAQAADAFLTAVDAEDDAAWEALLTSAAVAELHRDDNSSMDFNGDKIDSWVVGEATVEGDEASVAVTIEQDGEEQALSLKLRQESAGWRVFGFGMPMGDSEWLISFEGEEGGVPAVAEALGEALGEALAEGLTEAFENAQAEWEAGGSSDEIAAGRASFEALSSMDEAQHDAAWSIDVEADGRPAVDVLAELLGETGIAYEADEHFEHGSSLALSGVSRLEALEALCVEAGVLPVFSDALSNWSNEPQALTFRAGTRAWPVAFTGPFMVEAHGLEEHAPHSTGEVTLTVRALGLSPAVLAANRDMGSYLSLAGATSAAGTNLLADPETSWMGSPTVSSGLFVYSLTPDLLGLLRSVETLTLDGHIVLDLPTEVHAGAFDESSDATVEAGPWTVAWDDHGPYNQLSFRHADGETSAGSVRFAPSFSSGEPMGIQSESAYDVGAHLSASVATPETPAALSFKVYTSLELHYEFHLEGIALEHFAEQPARLEPLAFSGDAPIAVKFVRFGDRSDANFPKVIVSVSSRCNLEVTDASVTFEYLDLGGEPLEEFQHNLSGEFTFEGTAPLALVDQTSELETTAFFMPQGTGSIRVRVDTVQFVNGTTWTRE